MLTALLAVALWGVALPGIASLPGARRLFPDGPPPDRLVFRTVWGLALLGAVAALVNLVAPLGPPFALAALAAGLAGAWRSRRELLEGLDRADGLAGGAFLILLSVVAACPVAFYDHGLYHLSLVRWMSAGPVPLGLANLHERFGVSTLWFPVSPAMALPFAPGSEGYLPSTQIAFALAVAAWGGARRAFRGEAGLPDLFTAFGFLPLAWAFLDRTIPSSSPDVPVMALAVLSLSSLCRAFGPEGGKGDLLRAASLAVVATTFKLSAVPFALPVLVVTGTALVLRRAPLPTGLLAGAGFLFLSLAARSVAVTGHVVYPVSQTRIDALPWAVPPALVRLDQVRIASWARRPSLPLEAAIPFRVWAGPWATRNFRLLSWPVAAPGFYGAFLLAALPLLLLRPPPPGERLPLLVPFTTALAALAGWIVLAPDPRFALGTLYGLAMLPFATALLRIPVWPLSRRQAVVAALAASVLVIGGVLAVESARIRKGKVHSPGWLAPPPPAPALVQTRRTASGLEIRVPVGDDRCFDAPLPCTPFFRPSLTAEWDERGRIRSFSLPPDEPAAP